jgi:hypothetical protein
VYGDFVSHCKNYKNYWVPGDRISSSHETNHGINSDLRNMHSDEGNINAFYIGKDKYIFIPEPKIKKSDCIKYIPKILQASRLKTYIQGSTEWENQPLYVWDEHSAYIAGAETAIDDNKHNKDSGKGTDVLFGPLEFNVYATAVMMAAKEMDSAGFEKIKPFFLYNLKRSFNTYFAEIYVGFYWSSGIFRKIQEFCRYIKFFKKRNRIRDTG